MKKTFQIILTIGFLFIVTLGFTQSAAIQPTGSVEKVAKVELQVNGMEYPAQAQQLDAFVTSKEEVIASTTFFEKMSMVVLYKEDKINLNELIQMIADQGYAVSVRKVKNQNLVGMQYNEDGTLKRNLDE